jgi:tetratricopeptide (TPR) repeat protein
VLESGGDARRFESAAPAIDVLKSLCDKSLLRYDLGPAGDGRYMMLEVLREYAREKLAEAGQLERARQAHAGYYSQLIQAARPHLVSGGEQQEWMERLRREDDNLHAALAWMFETPDRGALALQFVEAMYHYWWIRGYLSEARRRLEAALAINDSPGGLQACVLMHLGNVARLQGDYAQARRFLEQSLAMQQQLNLELGMTSSWESLAILAGTQGDYAQAVEMFEQALAVRRKLGNGRGLTSLLNNLAIASRRLGNLDRAGQLFRESTHLCRENGDVRSLSHALHGLAEVQNDRGAYRDALTFLHECLGIRQRLGNRPSLVATLGLIGQTLLYLDDGLAAAQMFSAADRLRHEIGVAISPTNQAEEAQLIARGRALVGDDLFSQAWAQGQAMTADQAIAAALSKCG